MVACCQNYCKLKVYPSIMEGMHTANTRRSSSTRQLITQNAVLIIQNKAIVNHSLPNTKGHPKKSYGNKKNKS
jgi:hypothetical protein